MPDPVEVRDDPVHVAFVGSTMHVKSSPTAGAPRQSRAPVLLRAEMGANRDFIPEPSAKAAKSNLGTSAPGGVRSGTACLRGISRSGRAGRKRLKIVVSHFRVRRLRCFAARRDLLGGRDDRISSGRRNRRGNVGCVLAGDLALRALKLRLYAGVAGLQRA
jgi:hypothetical protein